jgi:hypothetical protein
MFPLVSAATIVPVLFLGLAGQDSYGALLVGGFFAPRLGARADPGRLDLGEAGPRPWRSPAGLSRPAGW